MSNLDAVRQLQNATTMDRMRNDQQNGRQAGDVMGRHDFLMLLSAQLRHQDPLNPQSDADFSAQLAQFSSLEQMMNMSESLHQMQAFSLVGQYVIANTMIDGRLMEIAGVVDSVFLHDGRKFAQIGENAVPVSDISEVFDGSVFGLPDQLIQTSSNLVGRNVKASVTVGEGSNAKESTIEGVVTAVTVERGVMHARIDLAEGQTVLVPIGRIFEIGSFVSNGPESAAPPSPPAKTERDPFELPNTRPYGDGFIQYDEQGNDIYHWQWDYDAGRWVGTPIESEAASAPPVTPPPETSQTTPPVEGNENPDGANLSVGGDQTYAPNEYHAKSSYDNYGGSYDSEQGSSYLA